MTIGIAVVGSGIFVKESHLPGIEASSDILSLKAIYSRSLASAKKLREQVSESHNPDLYADDAAENRWEKLLERDDVEGVIIALPITAQPAYIKQALLAGKHVLSEKPIAKDIQTAKELLEWYRENIDVKKTTWAVAENFRFLGRFHYGAEKVKDLGDVLGFRLRMQALMKPGAKYHATEWRQNPDYQGGFLLDGGPHFVAGMRLLLGQEAKMTRVSAFTTQLQPHLPPTDTVEATVRLANGRAGSLSISFGTTLSGVEYLVGCRDGTVDVGYDKTTVKNGDEEHVEAFPEDGNGVRQEVKAWGLSMIQGKPNSLQSPEEALSDLEVIESLIKSGEADGTPIDLRLQ